MFGINASYNSDARLLTRLVNILPNLKTDAMSNISLRTEFAYLKSSKPEAQDMIIVQVSTLILKVPKIKLI